MPLPLIPSGGSQIASGMPPNETAMPPMQPPGGLDLASLLGSAGPSPDDSLMGAASSAMRQFDQIAQMVQDLTRMFPGSEDPARQVIEGLDRWRQQVLMAITPTSTEMPGAAQMM